MARIVIVGGGFAGLFTALNLEEYTWPGEAPEVWLVDSQERFLFSPLLYELVSGELRTWEVAPRFEELLTGTRVRFRQAVVSGIDLTNGKVHFDDGDAMPYDRLVLAAGGRTPADLVPGAREHARSFRSLADAQWLIERLKGLLEQGVDPVRVALVGAGASGVELAAKLADTLQAKGSIALFEREARILPGLEEEARRVAQAELEARGVRLALKTKILEVNDAGLRVEAEGRAAEQIPAEVVLWTVGTAAPALLADLEVAKTPRGLVQIGRTLQVLDRPEIFALGDLAVARDDEDKPLAPSAQLAFQQAQFCAWNLWAGLTGRPLLEFRNTPLGFLMGLGVDSGFASLFGQRVSGQAAYLLRRLAYLTRMPTREQRLKVALNWFAEPFVRWLTP